MQLTRTQWLEQGLLTLAEKGPQHVKIDMLCQALGVTKGSFYHHFDRHAEFVTALLTHWAATNTQELIDAVQSVTCPAERGEKLSRLVYGKDMRPEVALRAWGKSHPEVQAKVNLIDAQRINYLNELAVQMGASASQAQLLAKMAYAQLVGIQHLQDHISPKEAAEMDHALHTMVLSQVRPSS